MRRVNLSFNLFLLLNLSVFILTAFYAGPALAIKETYGEALCVDGCGGGVSTGFTGVNNFYTGVEGQAHLSVTADFDNDGDEDIVVSHISVMGNEESILMLNDGTGAFNEGTPFSIFHSSPESLVSLIAEDVNGDGLEDLVTGTTGDHPISEARISVLINEGGQFTSPRSGFEILYRTPVFDSTYYPIDITPISINDDNAIDLIVTLSQFTGSYSETMNDWVLILENDGTGMFTEFAKVSVGVEPRALTVADFNNDGDDDFAIITNDKPRLLHMPPFPGEPGTIATVFIRTEDSFLPVDRIEELYAVSKMTTIKAEDINADGKVDLILGNGDYTDFPGVDNHLLLALNHGSGNFAEAEGIRLDLEGTSERAAYDLEIKDINRDGKLDIIALTQDTEYNSSVYILNGLGEADFATPRRYPFQPDSDLAPLELLVGDYNGDAKLDIGAVLGDTVLSGDNLVSLRYQR